jgi:hypothetical protein
MSIVEIHKCIHHYHGCTVTCTTAAEIVAHQHVCKHSKINALRQAAEKTRDKSLARLENFRSNFEEKYRLKIQTVMSTYEASLSGLDPFGSENDKLWIDMKENADDLESIDEYYKQRDYDSDLESIDETHNPRYSGGGDTPPIPAAKSINNTLDLGRRKSRISLDGAERKKRRLSEDNSEDK